MSLTWTLVTVTLAQLHPWEHNPKTSKGKADMVKLLSASPEHNILIFAPCVIATSGEAQAIIRAFSFRSFAMRTFICKNCGNEFQSDKFCKSRTPKYCSRKCAGSKTIGVEPWNKGIKMWEDREHPRGMLGKTGPNKGKKFSEEYREKLSKSHTGLKYPTLSAGNHWNWKGGVSKGRDKIKQSAEYKAWRTAVFERDDYTCQECHVRGGHLHAHHIKPFSTHERLRFDVKNGLTLCRKCHKKTDTYGVNKIHLLNDDK